MAEVAPEHSAAWQGLGVSILHRLVIETLLGANDLPKPRYVHLVEEVVEGLETGEFPLAALVMPATVDHIRTDQRARRADAGQEHLLLSQAAQRAGHQSAGIDRLAARTSSATGESGFAERRDRFTWNACSHANWAPRRQAVQRNPLIERRSCARPGMPREPAKLRSFTRNRLLPRRAVRRHVGTLSCLPMRLSRAHMTPVPVWRFTAQSRRRCQLPFRPPTAATISPRDQVAEAARLAAEAPPWGEFCAWPIRRVASARRPPRSTWPRRWPRPAAARLLVDLDPQCNATTGLGQQPTDNHPLVSRQPLDRSLPATDKPLLGFCPAAAASGCRSPGHRRQPRGHAQPASGQRPERVRLRADRLSALAGPADADGLGQLDRSADAHPVRVLRHGGPGPDDRGHPPGDGRGGPTGCSSAASC